MDSSDSKQFRELKARVTNLISEYRDARNLIQDQINAVINSDLAWLDSLLEQQLEKYKLLEKLELDFKQELEHVFRNLRMRKKQCSLSLLLETLDQPSKELNRLREELHQQVEKTQELRQQLVELLQFASEHNTEIFERIFRFEENKNSESYSADGQKKNQTTNSVAINHKV